MSEQAIRKDSWTPDDDNILAETVIRHIREGSTQLKAFDEVGERLNRTASACGFRWNATVRKQYEVKIQEAKRQRTTQGPRLHAHQVHQIQEQQPAVEVILTDSAVEQLDMIIEIANRYKITIMNMASEITRLRQELERKDVEINRLNDLLVNDRPAEVISEDYQTFLKILENARKLKAL
ncbi:RsfA family transcriptional regulator [Paenibacillus alkalitolerans]|uniref:RsfA family transcriptional regulator n=1 Tax=Paenibacillus alkalitolerans TaxID=2799335 RepID=UPI0018F32BED|nr:RsfA family transcriptional regulator [Paenibacillus alkalitolerans]